MLNILNKVPEGLLDCEARELYTILPGPTLMHLPGKREQPLFVSVLLHGNEDTGWLAIRDLLKTYQDRELPRSLSIFIGNVRAARFMERYTDGQPDYNRIWEDLPEMSAWWARIKERPSYAHAFYPGARISARYASDFKSAEELKQARGY